MNDHFGTQINLGDYVIFIQQSTLKLGTIETIGTDAVKVEYGFEKDGVELVGLVTRQADEITLVSDDSSEGLKELITAFERRRK